VVLIAEYSSDAHRVLISVKPAFGFRNLLNCLLRGGANSVDNGLLVSIDVCAHARQFEEDLDSQSPPERLSLHCLIEAFRSRVQPSTTPWQPELRIHNDTDDVIVGVVALRNNSQQCRSNITTTTTHTRSCHALDWPLTDPSQPIDHHYSNA